MKECISFLWREKSKSGGIYGQRAVDVPRREHSTLLQATQYCSLHYHDVLAHMKSEARIKLEFLVM